MLFWMREVTQQSMKACSCFVSYQISRIYINFVKLFKNRSTTRDWYDRLEVTGINIDVRLPRIRGIFEQTPPEVFGCFSSMVYLFQFGAVY